MPWQIRNSPVTVQVQLTVVTTLTFWNSLFYGSQEILKQNLECGSECSNRTLFSRCNYLCFRHTVGDAFACLKFMMFSSLWSLFSQPLGLCTHQPGPAPSYPPCKRPETPVKWLWFIAVQQCYVYLLCKEAVTTPSRLRAWASAIMPSKWLQIETSKPKGCAVNSLNYSWNHKMARHSEHAGFAETTQRLHALWN